MTIEEILKLGSMGYTKDDIESMTSDPEETETEVEITEPEHKSEPEPESVKQKEEAGAGDLLQTLLNKFDELNKNIQKANIINSNNPEQSNKTPEDILAEVIAPPVKKGGKTK